MENGDGEWIMEWFDSSRKERGEGGRFGKKVFSKLNFR